MQGTIADTDQHLKGVEAIEGKMDVTSGVRITTDRGVKDTRGDHWIAATFRAMAALKFQPFEKATRVGVAWA